MTGVGLARLAAGAGRMPVAASRALAGGLTVVLVLVGVTAWPPRVAEDGGWRLVDEAAARVARTVGGETVLLDGIPPFKSDAALRFPLLRDGVRLLPEEPAATGAGAPGAGTPGAAGRAVLVCDPCSSKPWAQRAAARRRTPGWPPTRRDPDCCSWTGSRRDRGASSPSTPPARRRARAARLVCGGARDANVGYRVRRAKCPRGAPERDRHA